MLPVLIALNVAVLGGIALLYWEHRAARRRRDDAGQLRSRELQELLAVVPDPLIVVDRDGRPLERFPGSGKTRMHDLLDELPDSEQGRFRILLRDAIDQQIRRSHRFQLTEHAIVADIVPLRYFEGRCAAAIVLRDVTDQELSATRLDELAARNRAILRSAMDGFFIVAEDHSFLEVNEAFCRMTGYSESELLRMKISELEVDEPDDGITETSRLRTGLHQFATAHRHKKGHIIRLETSVIVLRDGNRKILVGFARDVTERLRAEATFERLSRQNKLILDSAAEGIYGVDTEGRFTFVNPAAARMLGWETGELIGKRVRDVVWHARADGTAYDEDNCPLCGTVRTGKVQHESDARFRCRDGAPLPVEFVSSPIREQARVTGAVVVFRDISERKQAEEEQRQLEARFQQAQKLESLGMLAGGLAHDFNNLLLTVLCNATLATERVGEDEEARRHLDKIAKAARRASELTRQMLAYSGQASYDVHPVSLNALVEEMVELMRAALPKMVEMRLSLDEDMPLIAADGAQLHQVIMNLIINASEAIGHQSGVIEIKTVRRSLAASDLEHEYVGHPVSPGEHVCLEVHDDGCGMSAETLSRVFDPFYSTKATGRGLGLSALLGIVRSHRGAVRVSSSEGKGTVFTVLLPPAKSVRPRPAAPRKSATLPPDSTVLVVDDEEDIREVVQSVLESRGAQVISAADGRAGIECFRKHADEVDVVLLDMTMPGIGGDEVFREILSIRPDARVILSSGYSEQDMLARLDDQRLAGFVHKPYTARSLLSTISAALEPACAPEAATGEEAPAR